MGGRNEVQSKERVARAQLYSVSLGLLNATVVVREWEKGEADTKMKADRVTK
jgi:hypothetical protein